MINRLVSLELQGIKTFATLTRLEFPGNITAIVGPNGSGKSNIADSVRWVLGEQSYSLLRAKRTEDMIFSGSQQRARAGMAMTTITFNNEDGWLPIDYAEVSISRRAYRDGLSDYLLNGQKVRLKDISELLAQTGLSERTYTIIGQGLVDVALALKPDERRKLFEEAAGIGLYRSRKEEALRRLENTRKNLERVMDIMTEIRPRLRSLEKQADRFKAYEQLRADLNVLLREWYGYHWHQSLQKLQTSRYAYLDQEKRLNSLRKKNLDAETQVAEKRSVLQETRSLLEAAHSDLSQMHREIEEVTRDLAILDERRRSSYQQKDHLEVDIANLQVEISQLELQKTEFESDIENRQKEFKDASMEFNRVEVEHSNLTSQKAALMEELDSVHQSRIGLETERVQLKAHLEELQNRVFSLKAEKAKINASLEALAVDKEAADVSLGKESKTLQQKQSDLNQLQETAAQLDQQVGELITKKQDLNQKVSDQERLIAKSEAELDVIIQAEAALRGYGEGSKTIVENSRSGQLPAGIEPLSQHIIVAEKFEKAISAALGELADLLILPAKGKDVVIEYLENKEMDRVALVAVDQVNSQVKNKAVSASDGFFGYASDLIEVTPQYRDLVKHLFADILIVQDRKQAQRLLPKLRPTEKIVTLNGLVFQANGVMISGQAAAGKRIGRKRRQGEIRQQIMKFSEQMGDLEKQSMQTTQMIKRLKEKQAELAEQVRSREEESLQANLKVLEIKDQISGLEGESRWHQDRLASIEINLEEANRTNAGLNETLEQLDTEIVERIEKEKSLREKIESIPLFEVQQQLNRWQTHRIVVENALESARQRSQDHQHRLGDAQTRLLTFQERLSQIEENLDQISEEEAAFKGTADALNKNIDAIKDARITPLTSKIEELGSQITALEKLQSHHHQQVVNAERAFTQLQLELSRREDQLSNLRDRIEDDFGLVAFEYDQKVDGPTPLPLGDNFIESLPRVQDLPSTNQEEIKRLKGQIRRMGPINPEAQQEYYEVKERYEFLTKQIDDLEKASIDLQKVLEELDTLMERDFVKTFKSVNDEFSEYFSRLFNGGDAKLVFSDEENPVEGGVDIEVRLPGRRQQELALLSGGERSLAAVALVFALIKVSPTPFCILDEVDAMLDESNVGRFVGLLRELAQKTQFVIITHNRNTVQAADVIYGVTMGRDSTSQMISLKLEEVDVSYLE